MDNHIKYEHILEGYTTQLPLRGGWERMAIDDKWDFQL